MMVFHTTIIINRKNWRITIKLHFENLSIFLKKANLHICWEPSSPCLFLFAFQWSPLPSSTNLLFEWPPIKGLGLKNFKKWPTNVTQNWPANVAQNLPTTATGKWPINLTQNWPTNVTQSWHPNDTQNWPTSVTQNWPRKVAQNLPTTATGKWPINLTQNWPANVTQNYPTTVTQNWPSSVALKLIWFYWIVQIKLDSLPL